MDLGKYIVRRGSDQPLRLSKNSPKKTVRQFRSWLDNELRFNKGKKISRIEWEKRNQKKG